MAASQICFGVIALTGGIGEHDETLLEELEQAMAWLEPFELLRIPADGKG